MRAPPDAAPRLARDDRKRRTPPKEAVMKKILIATDGSASAREAVEFGLELAEEHAADVTFLHVVPVLDRSFADGIGVPAAVPHRIDEVDRRPLEDALALASEREGDAKAELPAGL